MITGYANIESAVEAVKTGAEEYLAKPFTDEELLTAVDRALNKLRQRRAARPEPTHTLVGAHGIIGESDAIRASVAFKFLVTASRWTNCPTVTSSAAKAGTEAIATSKAATPIAPKRARTFINMTSPLRETQ